MNKIVAMFPVHGEGERNWVEITETGATLHTERTVRRYIDGSVQNDITVTGISRAEALRRASLYAAEQEKEEAA